MERLKDAFAQRKLVLQFHVSDMPSAIREAVRHMVFSGMLSEQVAEEVTRSLLEREQETPTTIGHASAIPHAYLEGLDKPIVLFAKLAHPVNLGAPDGIATQFLFFLLGPVGAAGDHLDTLAGIAKLMSDDEFRYELGKARNDIGSALNDVGTAKNGTKSQHGVLT